MGLVVKLVFQLCLLYTSDAADDLLCVDLGGRRIIKKNFNGKSKSAKKKDWSTEYLSAKVSVKSVNNILDAINHINKYGTVSYTHLTLPTIYSV